MNEDFEYEFVAPKTEKEPAAPMAPQASSPEEFQYEFTAPKPQTSSPEEFQYEFNAPKTPQVGITEDIARTAGAKIPQSLLGTALGGLGSTESFITKDIPQLAKVGAAKVGESMDWLSPAEAQSMATKPIFEAETEAQKQGLQAPITGLPTYHGITEKIKERAASGEAPAAFGYEPQTIPGKVSGAAIEGAVQAAPGGISTLGPRMLAGAGAGAGGELFGQAAEGTETEMPARLLGSVLGLAGTAGASSAIGKLTNAFSSIVSDETAQKNLAKSLASDLERGQASMSPDQIKEAISRGEPVSVYDMAGPQTRKLLSQYTDVSPQNRQLAADYNRFLNDRMAESGARIADHLSGVTGRTIDAATLQAATEDAGKITRNNVYSLMRADPSASAISLKDIGGDLINRPMFQKAMKDAQITAKNNPDWDIKIASFSPPVQGKAPSKEMVGLQMVDVPGTAGTPARDIPGNISYWDQVKRELDAEINKAKRSGDSTTYASATAIKNQLTERLDNIVPLYKKARDAASETFGAASAPEAGYDFFGKTNQFKIRDIKNAFLQYTPEQKELFAHGVASRIQDEALKGNLTSLNNKFTRDVAFQDRMKTALGEDRFNSIKGKIISENMLRNAEKLKFDAEYVTPAKAGVMAAGAIAATEGAMAGLSAPGILRAAIAGVGAAGAKIAFNALERRIAERALPLALSQDAKDLAALSKMIENDRLTGKVIDKLNTALSVGGTQYEKARQESSERTGRATGGKVGRKTTAETLIALANRARKKIQNDTKPILEEPDEIVVSALKIANKHI